MHRIDAIRGTYIWFLRGLLSLERLLNGAFPVRLLYLIAIFFVVLLQHLLQLKSSTSGLTVTDSSDSSDSQWCVVEKERFPHVSTVLPLQVAGRPRTVTSLSCSFSKTHT